MIEIALYLPKNEVRYVLWLGRGGFAHGQSSLLSVIREEWDNGEVAHATYLWRIG